MAPASEIHIQGRRRIVRFRKKVHGTLGYAVTVKAAQKFCVALQNIYRPIDIEMDRFWAHGIPILCLYQPIALERSEPTSIGQRSFEISGITWLLWKINNQIEKIRCCFANILYDLNIRKIWPPS